MSTFECPVVRIDNLKPVPKSDALDIVYVFETPCIVRRGQLKIDDLAVYIPVESMVPMDHPRFQGLGIKTDKPVMRVKAVRLRGTYSEGLLVPMPPSGFVKTSKGPQEYWDFSVGTDMAEAWGITKYEEPEPAANVNGNVKSQQDKDITWAPKYNIEPLLKNRDRIPEGTIVSVTEKIHGCNARYSYGPDITGAKRLLVGSHNTWKRPMYSEPKWKRALKAFVNFFWPVFAPPAPINDDVWWKVAKRLNLAEKLSRVPQIVFYGEVYGSVQDLKYSVPGEEGVRFKVFDAYDAKKKIWLPIESTRTMCRVLGLETVPELYSGPYSKDAVDSLRTGKSVLDGVTMREGIVIRAAVPENLNDKQAYKLVSEDYKLRKQGTEFQ